MSGPDKIEGDGRSEEEGFRVGESEYPFGGEGEGFRDGIFNSITEFLLGRLFI